MKKPYYQSPFWRVVRRELQRMTSRRLYLWAALILPLFVVLFMATIFNTGQMENIPVAVVDQDFSATSRTITRMLDASPTLNVTEHLTNPADARQAMQYSSCWQRLIGFPFKAIYHLDQGAPCCCW